MDIGKGSASRVTDKKRYDANRDYYNQKHIRKCGWCGETGRSSLTIKHKSTCPRAG